MTPSTFAEFALLGVLFILAGFGIPALLQVRRTARVLEDFVREVGPQVESATAHLDSLLGRADRVAGSVETGTRGLAQALAGVGSFMSAVKSPGSGPRDPAAAWFSALASLLNGLWQTWNACTTARQAGKAKPAAPGEGGQDHVEQRAL